MKDTFNITLKRYQDTGIHIPDDVLISMLSDPITEKIMAQCNGIPVLNTMHCEDNETFEFMISSLIGNTDNILDTINRELGGPLGFIKSIDIEKDQYSVEIPNKYYDEVMEYLEEMPESLGIAFLTLALVTEEGDMQTFSYRDGAHIKCGYLIGKSKNDGKFKTIKKY